ncbi:PQQ-binding-like beta-propeller repeat protein [Jiulongibacter sediminis]|jgi:quinoprotein glucose dehydrogenase|uniref:outer membrane protein assembly factor BamB family protein n=1 Tax=Jiulongibacter sediminis TaxID=1605367 RepID=UPI0026EA2D1F|nr:PQQ-binding-like beta-propeller repeat protein [Jiulongibacter sediminis]
MIKTKYHLVLVCSILFASTSCKKDRTNNTWTHYGGSPEQSRYFEASEITKENVADLEVAWVYETSDDVFNFFSPIVVDTIMYVYGKNSSLSAINAVTGKEIWIHSNLRGITRRGINYWQSKDGKDRRLIFTINNTLQAIDAMTGKSILTFGNNGYVDLKEGLDRDPAAIRRIQSMMPGVIFEDLVILGSAPGENYFSPPGHVRAYNVVTGKMEWIFHTIPHPGEFGYDTWPKDAYKYAGGANVWSEISVDTERGIAYLPIGSPTFDFYGVDRLGSNLFGNSLVAVDARTGERIWHYQTVHHDLWDYDLSPAPQLMTVNRKGKEVDAVAVATKHGFLFVFDRVTGEPLFDIEEKPFPKSEMEGEEAWPTQPIPTEIPSFTYHEVTQEILNPHFSEETRNYWIDRLSKAKTGLYVPPSSEYETVMMPGALGGANYGNTAADPHKGIMYIMSQTCASVYKLSKVEPPKIELSTNDRTKARTFYDKTCQTCHGPNMEGSVGPTLKNVGDQYLYSEFKEIILNGRGQMPGFTHVDEETLNALYRLLGGNPSRFNFGARSDEYVDPEGPVVASGGVPIEDDGKRAAPMADYPEGTEHPDVRYTSSYDIEWTALVKPPWSYIMAYDLNTGKMLWKQPFGEDSLYTQGNPSVGAQNGTARKGMIVTSTGIVFANGKGGKVYAFDSEGGKILWQTTLSHETNAQPSMYTVNGKQYLVLNAASSFTPDSYDHSKKPGALPKGYVVYTLPNKKP